MELNVFYFGAALLMALLITLPALDKINFKPFGDAQPKRGPWRSLVRDFLVSELGAVSVTYSIRNGNGVVLLNSTTPPTATQAQQCLKQTAVVVFGVTADVQARFTHNWGLDISAAQFFEPEVLPFQQLSTVTAFPSLTIDWANTNVITINKVATDAPVTIVVTLRKPGSPGQ